MKTLFNTVATATFLVLTSLPATSQVQVRVDIPLPGLEIHVAHNAPPRTRSEYRPSRPGRDYLWVRGFWHWHASGWDWVPGRWDRPDTHGAKWVKTRYVRQGAAYVYQPGHWSNQHLIEGDDYRSWKAEHNKGQHRGHDNDNNRKKH